MLIGPAFFDHLGVLIGGEARGSAGQFADRITDVAAAEVERVLALSRCSLAK